MRPAVRARIGIAAGVTLGTALLIYGAWRLSHDAAPKAPAARPAPAVTRLLVASRDIARGETFSAGDVTTLAVQGEPPPGTLTAAGAVVGRLALNDIAARRLILNSDVTTDAGAAGLSLLVKPGYRAISLDASDEIAVGSFLRPGDRVDIEVVLPGPPGGGLGQARAWLRDIEVLAVGGATGAGPAPAPTGPSQASARTVTLAMTPDEVSRFVLARSAGRFYLTLRNPQDRGQPAEAAATGRPQPAHRASPAPSHIEVVVEGRREVIYPGAGRP